MLRAHIFFFLIVFFGNTGLELRASYLQDRVSTTWTMTTSLFAIVIFQVEFFSGLTWTMVHLLISYSSHDKQALSCPAFGWHEVSLTFCLGWRQTTISWSLPSKYLGLQWQVPMSSTKIGTLRCTIIEMKLQCLYYVSLLVVTKPVLIILTHYHFQELGEKYELNLTEYFWSATFFLGK
jgi:hypothetical protein